MKPFPEGNSLRVHLIDPKFEPLPFEHASIRSYVQHVELVGPSGDIMCIVAFVKPAIRSIPPVRLFGPFGTLLLLSCVLHKAASKPDSTITP